MGDFADNVKNIPDFPSRRLSATRDVDEAELRQRFLDLDYLKATSTDYNNGGSSITDGATVSTTVSVTGAAKGDPVTVGYVTEEGGTAQDFQVTGQVTSSDTVTVYLTNHSGGAVTLDNNDITVIVHQNT